MLPPPQSRTDLITRSLQMKKNDAEMDIMERHIALFQSTSIGVLQTALTSEKSEDWDTLKKALKYDELSSGDKDLIDGLMKDVDRKTKMLRYIQELISSPELSSLMKSDGDEQSIVSRSL